MTPMNRFSALVCALAMGLAAACSSPAPEPTRYLLRNEPLEGQGRVAGKPRMGLGRVLVAPYLLASPGIVVETEPGVVRPGNQHEWAEPLDQALRWFLRIEIGRALGDEVGGGLTDVASWDYTVDVHVGRLHGTMDGQALLSSGYLIRPRAPGSETMEYSFARSKRLEAEGYGALVEAQRQLLTQLAEHIAEGLKTAEAEAAALAQEPTPEQP